MILLSFMQYLFLKVSVLIITSIVNLMIHQLMKIRISRQKWAGLTGKKRVGKQAAKTPLWTLVIPFLYYIENYSSLLDHDIISIQTQLWLRKHWSFTESNTVEPWFNEPLFNKVLDITKDILRPGQSYSKLYRIEPQYNKPWYNEFFDITNSIQKPERKNLPRYNELQCQHATDDKRWTDQQSTNPLILVVKRRQPFSQRLNICHRHWHYSISTEVTCIKNQSLTMTSI